MCTSEAMLQVLSGALPHFMCSDPCVSKSNSTLTSKSHLKCRRKRTYSGYMQSINCSRVIHTRIYGVQRMRSVSHGNITIDGSRFLSCQCQQTDSISGIAAEEGNGTWFVDTVNKSNPINGAVNGINPLEFAEEVQQLEQEKEGVTTNGKLAEAGTIKDTLHKVSIHSIEDEAWDLLRESIVYYCGSPIGTIAAKDPTSPNVLNYDQVFIRDFIPSGIAFLLKGEYDIVRNFILHTLQLQVNPLSVHSYKSCNALFYYLKFS